MFRLLLPPVITVQPQSQTNNAGATVTFLVSATSPNPMGYQWQKNGTNLVDGGNISGATTNTLTITGISDSDAASYSVIVSNSNGSVTSSNATLTVIDPPVITAQPTNLLVLPGTNAAFGVSADRHGSISVINGDSTAPTCLTPRMPFTQFPRSARTMPEIIPW